MPKRASASDRLLDLEDSARVLGHTFRSEIERLNNELKRTNANVQAALEADELRKRMRECNDVELAQLKGWGKLLPAAGMDAVEKRMNAMEQRMNSLNEYIEKQREILESYKKIATDQCEITSAYKKIIVDQGALLARCTVLLEEAKKEKV